MVNIESKNRIYISFVLLFTVVLVCTILTVSSASILNYADANVGTEGIMDDDGDDGGIDDGGIDDGDIDEDYGNEDDEMETGVGGMDGIVIGCIQGNTCNGMNEEGGNAGNDLDKLINTLDLDSEKDEEEDNNEADNENIQQSIQTNVCSNGIFPDDTFCQNTASQI